MRRFPRPPIGESRRRPNELIRGGICTVTHITSSRDGPRVHYTIRRNGERESVAGGWMLYSEWFRLRVAKAADAGRA